MTKKISIDIPDELYKSIKLKATNETIKQNHFVGMNDIILPILKKAFGK